MCTSSATLFYGVCIKVLPLVVAARAWPRIAPVYLAIDLIQSRRRRGDLREVASPECKTVADLPDEIWEAVKAELSSDLYVEEVNSFVRGYHGEEECDCSRCLAHAQRFDDVWHLARCEGCYDAFLDAGGSRDLYEGQENSIQAVLRHFGLALAAAELLTHRNEPGSVYFDLEVSCAVAIPYVAEETADYPSASSETAHNGGGEEAHSMIDIDPRVFQLPPDAHARFRRLFATFSQLAVDPTQRQP